MVRGSGNDHGRGCIHVFASCVIRPFRRGKRHGDGTQDTLRYRQYRRPRRGESERNPRPPHLARHNSARIVPANYGRRRCHPARHPQSVTSAAAPPSEKSRPRKPDLRLVTLTPLIDNKLITSRFARLMDVDGLTCARETSVGLGTRILPAEGTAILLTGDQESTWSLLLKNLRAGDCVPFLGAGACHERIPLGEQMALSWGETEGYPLADTTNLPRVMQYIATARYSGDAITLKHQLRPQGDLRGGRTRLQRLRPDPRRAGPA